VFAGRFRLLCHSQPPGTAIRLGSGPGKTKAPFPPFRPRNRLVDDVVRKSGMWAFLVNQRHDMFFPLRSHPVGIVPVFIRVMGTQCSSPCPVQCRHRRVVFEESASCCHRHPCDGDCSRCIRTPVTMLRPWSDTIPPWMLGSDLVYTICRYLGKYGGSARSSTRLNQICLRLLSWQACR
jgi:hypothetical protein